MSRKQVLPILLILLLVATLACGFAAAPGEKEPGEEVEVTRVVAVPVEMEVEVEAAVGVELEPTNDQPYDDTFFENYGVNPFIDTEDDHLSTFALDVDTGSYTIVRR